MSIAANTSTVSMPRGVAIETQISRAVFSITVDRAEGLPVVELMAQFDPYVVLSFGDQTERTEAVSRTANPIWKHPPFELNYDIEMADVLSASKLVCNFLSFVIIIYHQSYLKHISHKQGVYLSLYDEDSLSADSFIGELMLDLDHFKNAPVGLPVWEWFPINANLSATRSSSAVVDVISHSSTSSKAGDKGSAVLGECGRIRIGFCWKELVMKHKVYQSKIRVALPCIGISLIRDAVVIEAVGKSTIKSGGSVLQNACELAYVSLSNITLEFFESTVDRSRSYYFAIEGIQVDAPGQSTGRPVLLFTERVSGVIPAPQLQVCCIREFKIPADPVDVYHYISVLLQNVQIDLEIDTLFDIYQVVSDILPSFQSNNRQVEGQMMAILATVDTVDDDSSTVIHSRNTTNSSTVEQLNVQQLVELDTDLLRHNPATYISNNV